MLEWKLHDLVVIVGGEVLDLAGFGAPGTIGSP